MEQTGKRCCQQLLCWYGKEYNPIDGRSQTHVLGGTDRNTAEASAQESERTRKEENTEDSSSRTCMMRWKIGRVMWTRPLAATLLTETKSKCSSRACPSNRSPMESQVPDCPRSSIQSWNGNEVRSARRIERHTPRPWPRLLDQNGPFARLSNSSSNPDRIF